MREIKFRAWSIYGKCIYDWEIIKASPKMHSYFDWPTMYSPMQYTGLKDKNGKEIYEGDFLGVWEDEQWIYYGAVAFNDYDATYFLAGEDGYATDYETYDCSDWSIFTIIGNIYENLNYWKTNDN